MTGGQWRASSEREIVEDRESVEGRFWQGDSGGQAVT